MKRIILITGATDGIGLETALQLAKPGHEIVLHGRTTDSVTNARRKIIDRMPHAILHTTHADLSDLSQVMMMAQQLKHSLPRLDVLINNAGVYMTDHQLSPNGIEMTMAVNHIAHFLLTALLLPLLQRSTEPRVVTVSSVAHMSGRIDFSNLNSEQRFNSFHAYCNSKLANILFAAELARREPWLTSNSLHPGVIDTKLLHAGFDMQGDTVQQGARTSVYLATSPAVKSISGKYFDNCRIATPHPAAQDASLAKKLWEWSEQQIQNSLTMLLGRTHQHFQLE